MTGGGQFIRFQMARGPWTGAHGRELWFDTELGDEYMVIVLESSHFQYGLKVSFFTNSNKSEHFVKMDNPD